MLEQMDDSYSKVVGIKQTRRAIAEGKARLVYLAEDVDQHLLEEIQSLCKEKNVEIVYVDSMKKLGEACGIDIKAASAAMLFDN